MAENIGQFISTFPLWLAIPIAIVAFAIILFFWLPVSASDSFMQWINLRKREKELKNDRSKTKKTSR